MCIRDSTNGLKGIEAAVAAGIVAGNTNKLLEVIADVKDEEIAAVSYTHLGWKSCRYCDYCW